jgi:hypothetical protein
MVFPDRDMDRRDARGEQGEEERSEDIDETHDQGMACLLKRYRKENRDRRARRRDSRADARPSIPGKPAQRLVQEVRRIRGQDRRYNRNTGKR